MRIDRKFIVAFSAVIIATFAIGYAATTLTITNSGVVTVATGTNLLVSVASTITSTTPCSASTGPYTDTSPSITTWSVPIGGSQTIYVCVWNNGPSSHTLVITGSGLPSGVSFVPPGTPVSVSASGYQLVGLTLAASSSAAPAPFSNAAISIT